MSEKYDEYDQQAWKEALSQLATDVRGNRMTKDEAYKWLKQHTETLSPDDQDEIYTNFQIRLECQTTPHNAIVDVIRYANDLVGDLEENDAVFPYWISDRKRVLLVSLLILGAEGRTFLFSTTTIGKLTDMSWNTIGLFLRDLIRRGMIVCEEHGGGPLHKPNKYTLAGEWHDEWKDIGAHFQCPIEPTENAIRERFTWMFDNNNPMNNTLPFYFSPAKDTD